MIAGIILAGGNGTRIKSKDFNKTALPFHGKPMIEYGVELLEHTVSPLIIVIGAHAQSVKDVLRDHKVEYANQRRRLGTAHAVKVAMPVLKKYSPKNVLVGYGDAMMFYKKKTISKLLFLHEKENAAVTLLTTIPPKTYPWGRIIRQGQDVIDIVEEKDATSKQRVIKECNVGFYCFNYDFLAKNIGKIKKSPVTQEYYLTDIVKIAKKGGYNVLGAQVPFMEVGIGINKQEELEESQKLYSQLNEVE